MSNPLEMGGWPYIAAPESGAATGIPVNYDMGIGNFGTVVNNYNMATDGNDADASKKNSDLSSLWDDLSENLPPFAK